MPKFKIGDKVIYIGTGKPVPGPMTIVEICKSYNNYKVKDANDIHRVITGKDLKGVDDDTQR